MKELREHVVNMLRARGAHLSFDEAVAGLPPRLHGAKPVGVAHSPWELLEHMRIAQWDILEFSRNPEHVSPEFPEGYWPKHSAPPEDDSWSNSVAGFCDDLEAMIALVEDPENDLFAPFPHGQGQTLLREALIVADHNAYHLGQLVALRRILGAWPGGPESKGKLEDY